MYNTNAQAQYYASNETAEPADKAYSSNLPLPEQEKSLDVLHEAIGILEGKLSMVLLPEQYAENTTSEAEPEPEVSSLHKQIKANNRGINRAIGRINNITARLDV